MGDIRGVSQYCNMHHKLKYTSRRLLQAAREVLILSEIFRQIIAVSLDEIIAQVNDFIY